MVSVQGGILVLLESSQKAHRFVLIAPNESIREKRANPGGREAPTFRLDIYVSDRISQVEEIGRFSGIGLNKFYK